MRLFTAIDIPDEIRQALHSFVRRLRPLATLRWSAAENMHITTKFIGEWPETRFNEMRRALAAVCEPPAMDSIAITIKGVGWFPDARRPRVFWAGVEGGESLHALASRTEQATGTLGIPVETRVFSPHLTLARIGTGAVLLPVRAALQALPSGGGFDFGSFEASEFFVYLSAGGKYTKLESYRFAAVQVS